MNKSFSNCTTFKTCFVYMINITSIVNKFFLLEFRGTENSVLLILLYPPNHLSTANNPLKMHKFNACNMFLILACLKKKNKKKEFQIHSLLYSVIVPYKNTLFFSSIDYISRPLISQISNFIPFYILYYPLIN